MVDQSAQTCPGPCGRFSLVKDLSCLGLFHTSLAPVAFSLSLLYRWPNCPVCAHLYLISQVCYLLCPECPSTHTHTHTHTHTSQPSWTPSAPSLVPTAFFMSVARVIQSGSVTSWAKTLATPVMPHRLPTILATPVTPHCVD